MAWVPWLGYLGGNIWNIPLIFLLCFKEKVTVIRITLKVGGESLVNLIIHCEPKFPSVPCNSIKSQTAQQI